MEVTLTILGLVASVIGLTEVIKKAFKLPKRLVPFVAVVLGIVLNIIVGGFAGGIAITGIMIGLTSCGLFSLGKTTLGK